MSRRTIMSLAATAIIGIGFIGAVSSEASAYYRGGVYRGGVYRGGVYRGGYYRGVRPGVAVGIGAAAVGAAAVLLPPALTTDQVTTALLLRSVVHTATIIMPPTTAVYPRHSRCYVAQLTIQEAPRDDLSGGFLVSGNVRGRLTVCLGDVR